MNDIQSPAVLLKPGREKSVLLKHPWVFSGSIQKMKGEPQPGETVDVYSSKGEWLCRGAYSPHSNIRVRIWTWNFQDAIDREFIDQRIKCAVSVRNSLQIQKTDMFRLVNAESDGLPGLVVDRYRDVLVVQFLSAGMEFLRNEVVSSLAQLHGVSCIYERSDLDVRELEGLPHRAGVLQGEFPPQPLVCEEGSQKFYVDLSSGHKTGFYLDQRANRQIFEQYAAGQDVLNCFSYTGAFSVIALAHGAKSVSSVDSSDAALDLCQQNVQLNQLDTSRHMTIAGDVFQVLRTFRDQGKTFDVIVLDPPKFAPTSAQAQRAARGYKDINLLAFKLLRPGGWLFTFSCSGGVSMALFEKIVASAALDAGVQAQIVRRMRQDADHPVRLSFPEASYLKGLLCRVPD